MLLSILLSGSVLHSKMIAHQRWKINFGKRTVWWRIGLGFGQPSAIYNSMNTSLRAGLQYKYLKNNAFLRLICMEEA
jgi:hypothetical protein